MSIIVLFFLSHARILFIQVYKVKLFLIHQHFKMQIRIILLEHFIVIYFLHLATKFRLMFL